MRVIEFCYSQNPQSLVKKDTPEKYQLINIVVKLNRVTLRDTNLPLSVDVFSKEFENWAISSLIDFFSGYNQVELDKKSLDLTAFMTPLVLMQMSTLLQTTTNLVA